MCGNSISGALQLFVEDSNLLELYTVLTNKW